MPKKSQKKILKILRAPKTINYDDWQMQFLATKGDKILCTGRQVGKSLVCAKDAGDFALNNPESEPIVIIAPTERQASALFQKTLNYLAEFHGDKIAMGTLKPTKERITLTSGVEIYCLPVGQSGMGIRFLTIGRLYVDEASRVPENVWEAITPALLTTGGDMILLSTPFGAQGEFYNTWINLDGAYDSFTRFSVDSEKVMRERPISESWTELRREKSLRKLEQAKKRMTTNQYAQEYMGEFVEALIRWFPDALIRACAILKRPGSINPDSYYFLGVDLARMGGDEITFEILEKRYGQETKIRHVENIVDRKQLMTWTFDKIIALDKIYNFQKIGIDAGSGSMGVMLMDFLLRSSVAKKCEAIDNKTRFISRDEKQKKKLDKVDLYRILKSMMEQGEILLLDDDNLFESFASVQFEWIMKNDEPTELRIFGNYTHIVEGLTRAAVLAREKSKNFHIHWA